MKKHKAFIVFKLNNTSVFVLLIEHKNGGYSFVNITKMHICQCIFDTIEEAIEDLDNFVKDGKIDSYVDITHKVDMNAISYSFLN